MNQKSTLSLGALFGMLAVGLGAFGAHSLKPMLVEAGRFDTYELAVRYQFFHTFALLIVGLLMSQNKSPKLKYASLFFVTGIVVFSGSLYLLCFTGIKVLGAITPIGGVLFILGWLFLLLGVNQKN